MTLATVDESSRPSARVVLIKDISRKDGYLTFYSNYASRKSEDLDGNASAAGVLHWDKLGRQIRFEGYVTRSPESESDAYFATRPIESQLNAWTSEQSQPLEDISLLETRRWNKIQEFGLATDQAQSDSASDSALVPRPPFWGGYRFWFTAVELWQEGEDRYHDRLRYERTLIPAEAPIFESGPWTWQRLQP
jgi:pyridoxamine 5'-phosphate oxidase